MMYISILILLLTACSSTSFAALDRLEVQSSEVILGGKSFGLAGAYKKVEGKAHFSLDPESPANAAIVDLKLAPRNASGRVEFAADFYLLAPVDGTKSNGKLLYEVGNRGTKAALRVFQLADTANPFGDGFLMSQGYSIVWMGWQWDVPQGRMRMELPVASDGDKPILGLVRSNFILYKRSSVAELADRNHVAYTVANMENPNDVMTVRDTATGTAQKIPRNDWQMLAGGKVSLKGGFAPGMIYEVIYQAKDPRVLGCSFAATRDLLEYFKAEGRLGLPAMKWAYGWGVSQSGRYLRHFLYEGFNQRENGGKLFDGVIDEVGGAGRGGFNQRFGQASRDAEQHFNFFYPVDQFPFADGMSTDPFSKKSDALLARSDAQKVTPFLFHVLSSSEYYNRAGSLIHTDPEGKTDLAPPATSRIYLISSMPHFAGSFPPTRQGGTEPETNQELNPLNRASVMRALLVALDEWVALGKLPPESRYPKIIDRTLVPPTSSRWPSIPNVVLPPPALKVYSLDFSSEPPKIGPQYPTLVPAVDETGHDIAGVRMPLISVPLATHTGWNYRHPSAGASTELAGETGSWILLAPSRARRNIVTDSRPSIGERYPSQEHFLGMIMNAARELVRSRFLLADDLPALIDQANQYWAFALKQN
jgi:hypothetical protein